MKATNTSSTILGLLALACGLGSFVTAAESELPEHNLSEWKFGTVLQGESYTHEDLEGKVVVLENWGVQCGPCVALMPHLAEMDKRNHKKGLRIIGAEVQNSSEEDIKSLTEENKANYTITRHARGPIPTSGIPHAFVFNASGTLVFSGDPQDSEFEKTIKKSLREVKKAEGTKKSLIPTASKPLIAERDWTNSEGNKIVASALLVAGEHVTFKMKDGRSVAYPINQLSEEDQTLLKETAEADSEE